MGRTTVISAMGAAAKGSLARSFFAALRSALLLVGLSFGASATAGDRETILEWIMSDAVATLSAGEVITADERDRLAAVLPPAFLARLDFPELSFTIAPPREFSAHPLYLKATQRFAGQASLAADGSLAGYTAGQPFSKDQIADAAPREAALMVAWNSRHRWTHYGYRSKEFLMCYLVAGTATTATLPENWGGTGNCERSMRMTFHRVYLRHVAQRPDGDYRLDVRDSERFLYKDVMRITDPFDVAGTAFMIERPLAFGEQDQVHSYLPGERRVRRLSARERADAFMGSDFTLDDLEAWSGKIADYDWQYLGSRVVAGVMDSRNPHSLFQGPLSDIADDHWQLRDTHAVIATPLWDEHPYGARIMFFDKETYVVLMTLVLDRSDALWKILYPIYAWPEAEGDERSPGETAVLWRSSVALDIKNQKSSATQSFGTDLPAMEASDVRRIFSASNLTEGR